MSDETVMKKNHKQQTFMDWSVDILIYTVILNLFVEYSSAITIDSFTISLFTAVVLKALLSVIIRFEHSVGKWFSTKDGKFFKLLGPVVAVSILFLSKFAILEIINFIFKEHVTIKGFIPLALMIIAMIATRKIIEKIYKSL